MRGFQRSFFNVQGSKLWVAGLLPVKLVRDVAVSPCAGGYKRVGVEECPGFRVSSIEATAGEAGAQCCQVPLQGGTGSRVLGVFRMTRSDSYSHTSPWPRMACPATLPRFPSRISSSLILPTHTPAYLHTLHTPHPTPLHIPHPFTPHTPSHPTPVQAACWLSRPRSAAAAASRMTASRS